IPQSWTDWPFPTGDPEKKYSFAVRRFCVVKGDFIVIESTTLLKRTYRPFTPDSLLKNEKHQREFARRFANPFLTRRLSAGYVRNFIVSETVAAPKLKPELSNTDVTTIVYEPDKGNVCVQ